ncbi:hypothetical protein B0H17DRAFT_1134467 [Mycena rosella]|uniref:Uncharacterized protein n=1 Tax=Mycena rosella TaxID=1033263 RepID=A0AAD7DH76_MYCRO|nr:hypothetical protein B0H17DRAFT_1134467 [Mycena rosella]
MSSTQSPSPITAPVDLDVLKGLFGDTAPADPPSCNATLDDVEATLARKLREEPEEMRDALTKVFRRGAVDKVFINMLEQLAATVARLQQNFDTVSVALVMFDDEKYIDPATQQPIPEYRPDWVKLSAKYTELLTTSRKFAGTIQFRATKYPTQILPALKNPKLSKADKLKSLDWFLKDTAEDIKEGGAYEDIEKDEKIALFLSQGFANLALAVHAFLDEHLKVIADSSDTKAKLTTADFDLHTAQKRKKKFVSVIQPALGTATAAMNNIIKNLRAIASILKHITVDANEARMALQDALDDETPQFLKEHVYELTTKCFAKLVLALEAFAAGCDNGLGPLA